MDYDEKLKKYIKKKFYKNDEKIITIHIEKESELYNNLDGMKDTLSDDVTEYLERSTETLLPLNQIQIKVECKEKVDLDNLQNCLKVHYGIELLNHERIEKMVKRKKIVLLLIAILASSTFLFFEDPSEIRSFVVTLSIWEFVDLILNKDEEDEIKNYTYEMLERAIVIK